MSIKCNKQSTGGMAVEQQPIDVLAGLQVCNGGIEIQKVFIDITSEICTLSWMQGTAMSTQVQCIEMKVLLVVKIGQMDLKKVVDESMDIKCGCLGYFIAASANQHDLDGIRAVGRQ